MRLSKDLSAGARSVSVTCVKCGRRTRLSQCWSDVEGRAFVDYYCDTCSGQIDAPRFVNGYPLAEVIDPQSRHGGQMWDEAITAFTTGALAPGLYYKGE